MNLFGAYKLTGSPYKIYFIFMKNSIYLEFIILFFFIYIIYLLGASILLMRLTFCQFVSLFVVFLSLSVTVGARGASAARSPAVKRKRRKRVLVRHFVTSATLSPPLLIYGYI